MKKTLISVMALIIIGLSIFLYWQYYQNNLPTASESSNDPSTIINLPHEE